MLDRVLRAGCLLIALATAPAPACAQSLKTLRARAAEETALAREIAYTNTVCSSDMAASIDWGSAAGWPAGGLAAACDNALGALEAACRSSGKAKARAQALNNFVCAGDGSGPSLRGGSFRYGASIGGNGFAETKSYLDGAL